MKSQRLLILACSLRKRPNAGTMPAIERYDGPLWQTLRTVETPRAAVMFLSAKYGYRSASDEIENYDLPLSDDALVRAIKGARSAISPKVRGSASVVAALTAGRGPFTEVCLVGGHRYLRAMRAEVAYWKRIEYCAGWHFIAPDVRVRQINAPIGAMRKRMRKWLEEAA